MKKIFIMVIMALMVLLPTLNVDAKENDKVTIHIFYAEWCGNCTNLHNFINELEKDKEYNEMFEAKFYRIDNEKEFGKNPDYESNVSLYNKVKTHLGYNEGYIPFYIIGDKYEVGYSTTNSPATIKNAIRENYFSKDYKDVVQDIIDNKIEVSEPVTTQSKTEEAKQENSEKEKKDSNNTQVLGIAIIIVTLVIVVAAIVFSMIKK